MLYLCSAGVNGLMSCQVVLRIGVCFYETFENYFPKKHWLPKYLKKNCRLNSVEHFSLKKIPKCAFVREFSSKLSDCFYVGCGCERVDGMSGRVEDLMDGGLDRNTIPARGLLTYFTDDHNHLCVLLNVSFIVLFHFINVHTTLYIYSPAGLFTL